MSRTDANLYLYTCEDSSSGLFYQTWEFEYNPGTSEFRIRSVNLDQCVDIVGDTDPANGVNVVYYDCHNTAEHYWEQVFIDY